MSRTRVALLVVLIIALGGIAYPLLLHRTPWLVADETMYARGAWNLAHRRFLIPDVPGTMNYPPLYAAILSPASLIPDIRAAYAGYQMINVALWLLGGVLAYAIARRARSVVPAPLVAAACLAIPAAVSYVPLVMSENLSLVLLQLAAFSLYRAVGAPKGGWLLVGWAASLAALFCRATGIIVPCAFLIGVTTDRRALSRWVQGTAVGMTCLTVLLLAILPTSILKTYHPLATASVAAKTLGSIQGWRTLLGNAGTTLALVIVGSAGLVWRLGGRAASGDTPIRRFLAVIVAGQALMTIGYMQYGSAGPNAESYRVVGRYLDPGIAAVVPWLLSLEFRPRRLHWLLPLAGAALAVLAWPSGGYKLGQTLSSAGLGLSVLSFGSILGALPIKLAVAVLAAAPGLLVMTGSRRLRTAAAAVCALLFLLVSHDALAHEVALSRAREASECGLWRLHRAVPPKATVMVDRSELTPELWTALYSGLFWLPSVNVQSADLTTLDRAGSVKILVSRNWRPDRIVHAASHTWYWLGESPPPVDETVAFHDLGPCGQGHLFSAPLADGTQARWSGELPVIELHAVALDTRITFGLNPDSLFGRSVAQVFLNGRKLGQFGSSDSLVSVVAPASVMRPDGRQLLSLRVSPLDGKHQGRAWINGVRLDWIAVEALPHPEVNRARSLPDALGAP
ncbi:MAG: hypothetical protein MUE60_02215 [Candidatus Eisenbacteria bacterium]|jgi:hypothetical protein|nr:hypothetical protein [Candidatus Eisenbacteria bacterium]